MAEIIVTLRDTNDGGVSVSYRGDPHLKLVDGNIVPETPAQAVLEEFIKLQMQHCEEVLVPIA